MQLQNNAQCHNTKKIVLSQCANNAAAQCIVLLDKNCSTMHNAMAWRKTPWHDVQCCQMPPNKVCKCCSMPNGSGKDNAKPLPHRLIVFQQDSVTLDWFWCKESPVSVSCCCKNNDNFSRELMPPFPPEVEAGWLFLVIFFLLGGFKSGMFSSDHPGLALFCNKNVWYVSICRTEETKVLLTSKLNQVY